MDVVRHGFAHAHDDDVVDHPVALDAFTRGLAGVPPLHGEDLPRDFVRMQVSLPAVESAGAEPASVRAADLRGDAERVAVAAVAVEGWIGGNEDAFDQAPSPSRHRNLRVVSRDPWRCNNSGSSSVYKSARRERSDRGRFVISSQLAARRA